MEWPPRESRLSRLSPSLRWTCANRPPWRSLRRSSARLSLADDLRKLLHGGLFAQVHLKLGLSLESLDSLGGHSIGNQDLDLRHELLSFFCKGPKRSSDAFAVF